MSFTKQHPLINTLFGHGFFSPALGDVGASTRGSQMQSVSLSLQLFMNCLFLDLSASSLTIKISLACSLSELTVHTTCCFTPRSKGYISSFLLELSLKHWCCEPPPTLILQFQLTFHAQQHRWCLFQETLLHLLLSFLLCSHGFVTTPSHCIFKYFSFIIKGTQAYSTKFGGGQKEQVCLLESPTCTGRNLVDA